MQHYKIIDGHYVLHELDPIAGARVVRAKEQAEEGLDDRAALQKGYITAHPQIAIAYYADTHRCATHGSPETMAVWARQHNAHSRHKVEVLTLPKGHSVDDVNKLIHDEVELQRLIGAPPLK